MGISYKLCGFFLSPQIQFIGKATSSEVKIYRTLASLSIAKPMKAFRPKYSTQHVFPHHFPSTVDTGSEFSMKLLKEFCELLSEFILMGTHHEVPGSNLAPVITYLRGER